VKWIVLQSESRQVRTWWTDMVEVESTQKVTGQLWSYSAILR